MSLPSFKNFSVGARYFFLFSVSIYFFAIILSFAWVDHETGGIVDNSGTVATEYSTCLYFNIVAFTTLGYGDFHPTDAARGMPLELYSAL
ncbi:MAG: hypothetical protein AYK18_14550 [Theionarchaea archaeon DG-70]|nr:MAG: hypothetical protein AYK18_14550 [Theionarchaea archaeon DG-70]